MYAQQGQLPVSFQQVDQSTFNGNLPAGNDKIPQLQLSQLMQNNQAIAATAVGLFRATAQGAVQKSPLHIFVYNLLSQNWFQNNIYQQWCQTTVDFAEFLCAAKQYQPQDAVARAAQYVYESLLAQAVVSYPALLQMNVVQQTHMQGLQVANQRYQQMINDIQAFKQGRYQPQQQMQQQQPMQQQMYQNQSGNLPPVNSGMGNYATTTQYTAQTTQYPTASQDNGSNAYYDTPATTAPMVPKEEISSDVYGSYHNNGQQPMQMQQPVQATQPEQTDLPVPTDVSEVQVDPMYYQPQGFKMNLARPYDEIHNPGGIVIKPAHLTSWERTSNDFEPYSEMADPGQFCRFFVKFPDGVVKEKFVPWNPQMQYLDHELNDDLRRREYRPTTVIVAAKAPISTIGSAPTTATAVKTMVVDGDLPKEGIVNPIILDGQVFTGASDLEIEGTVLTELRELLGIDDTDEEARSTQLPAHEYKSMTFHQLDVSEETYKLLEDLGNYRDLQGVAAELKSLVQQGHLNIRYYRFLNERLTRSMNDFLKDNLSIHAISIDDFCNDIGELLDYLASKKGAEIVQIVRSCAVNIITRAITTGELDGEYGVLDQYVNFQMGWTLEQLSTLNILSEHAVLVSNATHPTVIEVLKGMINRNTGNDVTPNSRMRLITLDGVYLEVIRGRLIEKAILLKRMK